MGLNEKRKISIVGGHFEDIVLYLIRIIQNLGYKTVVCDHTCGHRIYPLIPHLQGIEPSDTVLDYRGIGYTFGNGDRQGKSAELESSDCIVRLYDISGYVSEDEPCIFITDESKRNLDLLNTLDIKGESMMIVKDYTGIGAKRTGLIAEKFNCRKVFAIPYNIKDRKNAVKTEYSDIYRFDSVSGEMEKLLHETVLFIFPETDGKALKKAYSRASKGGIV